jgi:hypothetical protein
MDYNIITFAGNSIDLSQDLNFLLKLEKKMIPSWFLKAGKEINNRIVEISEILLRNQEWDWIVLFSYFLLDPPRSLFYTPLIQQTRLKHGYFTKE